MPNVLLKNEIGEDIAYNDVDTVTLRRVEGGTATYTFQRPNPTDDWKMLNDFISGDARTNLISKSQVVVPSGRIISSSDPGFGTWYQSRYDAWRISTSNLNQMYAVPNGAILAYGNTSSSLYLWDDETLELKVLLSNTGQIHNFREYNGKYFISTYYFWLIYDPATKEVTQLLTGYSMSTYCFELEDELLLSVANNSSNNPQGIYSLSPETFELTQIYDQGWYWLGTFRTSRGLYQSYAYIMEVEDGYLFGGYSSSAVCNGVLYYDKVNGTVTRLLDIGYYWFNDSLQNRYAYSTYARVIPGYGVVFSNGQTYAWGTWYFDFETKTATRIAENAYFYNWVETDDLVYGCYSSFGVILFDKTTKTWYRPVTSGMYEMIVKCENGFLLGPQSNSYGIKYYEIATGQVTTITTNMNYWRYGISVEGGALMSNEGTSNSGVWYFDETEKTFTQVSTIGYAWRMVRWHDSILMGGFNANVYGWMFYKNGEFTYNQGFDGNQRNMRCIVPVEDGWLISSWSYNTRVAFIDGETGEATNLEINTSQIGPYVQAWYGHGGVWKPSYDYNRKYGRYRVISSYDGYGFIFDDITHSVIPMTYWYDNNPLPTPGSTTKTVYMRRVSFVEYAQNWVMIITGSSNTSGVVTFNYATGEAYLFNGAGMYATNDISYWFTPLTKIEPVGDGFLIFIRPFEWKLYPNVIASTNGVWHINTTTNRLKRLYTSGYYDSVEEAPGGKYIYLSSLPKISRLYWNEESKTLTKVDY